MSEPTKKPMRDDYWIFMGPSGMPRAVEKCTFMPTINPQRIEGGEWINFKQVDPAYDAMVVAMTEALEGISTWFNSLSKKQDDLLGKGLDKACENWDEASLFENNFLDFTKVNEALALYREWVSASKT